MTVHAIAGKTGLVFVFVHARVCSGLSHLMATDQTDLQAMSVRANMAMEVSKAHFQSHVYCGLVVHQEIGLSNDFAYAGSTQQHWPFPGHKAEETGYAYILTHPGMPCIMWEHYFDYGLGGCIKHLIEVRWVVRLDYQASSHYVAC